MGGRKIKMTYQGKEINGVEIDIKESEEKWSKYTLKDGTVIKIKLVVTQIVRTEE